jgi:hypothetical protein
MIQSTQLYLAAFFGSSVLNSLLLVLLCTILSLDGKSEIIIFMFGTAGYFIKAIFCFLPYRLLNHPEYLDNRLRRNLVLWSPLILYACWFLMVILFQMETFYTDLSFGYLVHFPHFLVQLTSVLIACIVATLYVYRKMAAAI